MDTYADPIHVEWDPDATMTPLDREGYGRWRLGGRRARLVAPRGGHAFERLEPVAPASARDPRADPEEMESKGD